MNRQQLPSLGETIIFRDEHGHASLWYASAAMVRVETAGFMAAALVNRVVTAIEVIFASLPDDAPRVAFMDHRRVTGIGWGTPLTSLRWFLQTHDRFTVHMLSSELPAILRFWLWTIHPIIASSCEFHATVESFESALEDHVGTH